MKLQITNCKIEFEFEAPENSSSDELDELARDEAFREVDWAYWEEE